MPQLNTSIKVKQRIEVLLQHLLAHANQDLTSSGYLPDKIRVRWLETDPETHKLVVETELRFLAQLLIGKQDLSAKEQVRNVLRVLQLFLGILEDYRTKIHGSPQWFFCITLWSKSLTVNLEHLEQEWQLRTKRAKLAAIEPSQDLLQENQGTARRDNPHHYYLLPGLDALLQESSILDLFIHPGAAPGPQPAATPSQTGPKITPDHADRAHTPQTKTPQTKPPQTKTCQHNLPAPNLEQLFDRPGHLDRLLTLLDPNHASHLIRVEGISGVGKTSLVLSAAHQVQAQFEGQFEAIVFTSAKSHYFTPQGLLPRSLQDTTLPQILEAIARTLACAHLLQGSLTDQCRALHAHLTQCQLLLIIDNFETLAAPQMVHSFLHGLPATVKVVITSRQSQPMQGTTLRLEPLGYEDSLDLLQHEAQLQGLSLSPSIALDLYQSTGGIAAALSYGVAQLARGYGLTEALERLHRLEGDFGHYHFAPLFRSLQGQAAYYLILALALFPQPATKGAIAHTALLDVTACGDGFATLYQHSWVTWQRQDDRYALLPLVRTYALGELQTYPEFAQEARHHQLNWYLEHLAQAPPQSWLAAEQETLQALLRWCESQNYQDQCQRLKPHILKNF